MQTTTASLFDELDAAIASGSSERRVNMLRRVTDLFLVGADRLSEEQIEVFDDVLGHLIERVEARTLAQISKSLAPVANAPTDVTLRLARHDQIEVAGPILTLSKRLSAEDLADIARTKSQQHLLAISLRSEIETVVTDVLLDRGNNAVLHQVAANPGAKISERGYRTLMKASEDDETLAEKTGLRLDIPLRMLKELLLRATEAVRERLMSRVPADKQDEFYRALTNAAEQVARRSSKARSYEASLRIAKLMHERGELTDRHMNDVAAQRRFEDTVAGLAVLTSLPIETVKPLMDSPREEGLLIACKGSGLSWPTTRTILECRLAHGAEMTEESVAKLETEFTKLTRSNAERLLRFWRVRQVS